MTELAIDFLGYTYDVEEPAFINVSPAFYWHRPSVRYIDKPAIDKRMTDEGYTPGAKEIADAADWLEEHLGIAAAGGGTGTGTGTGTGGTQPPAGGGTQQPPAQTPSADPAFTVTATGISTASIDVSLGGDPSNAGSITVAGLAVDGVTIDGITAVAVVQGETGHAIAVKISDMLGGLQDANQGVTILANASGSQVDISEIGGGNIDAGLTATFA